MSLDTPGGGLTMRVLFMVSDGVWNASARASVLAARGLAARGHEVQIACAAECPVQVHAKAANIQVISLAKMGSTLELRALNVGQAYWVAIESFDENGVSALGPAIPVR